MSFYESECGTKQSSLYEVRHFYKKLYFNLGICEDSNEVGYLLSLSLLFKPFSISLSLAQNGL